MPSAKKQKQPDPIEDIQVKLKSIAGMSPRFYVPIAWLLLAGLVVFMLLVLPGLRKSGTYLTVNTIPPDAEVIFDNVRLGPSGTEVFAPGGEGTFTIRKAGYSDYTETRKISGRIFASRLFHRKETLSVTLRPLSSYNPLTTGYTVFSAWAATGPENGRYAIPSSLTQYARESASIDKISSSPYLNASLSASLDERHLADILRSESILSSGGGAPTIRSLATLATQALENLDQDPKRIYGIGTIVSSESFGDLNIKVLKEKALESQLKVIETYKDFYLNRPNLQAEFYGSYRFVVFPSQEAPLGDMEIAGRGLQVRTGWYPHISTIESFALAGREVSNSEYALFINEEPNWSPANREELVAEGLADDAYLSDWSSAGPAPGSDKMPVTGVSWFAAAAYAEWFTSKYLDDSIYKARLPMETEWELAARWNSIEATTEELSAVLRNTESVDSGRLGILGMAGSVREWSKDPFLYNAALLGNPGGSVADHVSMTVRGGAFIDPKLEYPAAVRGSLPPEVTSPVVGFRLVLQ